MNFSEDDLRNVFAFISGVQDPGVSKEVEGGKDGFKDRVKKDGEVGKAGSKSTGGIRNFYLTEDRASIYIEFEEDPACACWNDGLEYDGDWWKELTWNFNLEKECRMVEYVGMSDDKNAE